MIILLFIFVILAFLAFFLHRCLDKFIHSEEKIKQERTSLEKVDDSFKKIIVLGEECPITRDEQGITTIGIYDFLLKENSLEL